MNAQELKEQLSAEDVIKYVTDYLGSDDPIYDNEGNPIFQTICHNPPHEGSYKLYYYIESKQFHCYTHCGDSFDIFELTCRAKSYDSVNDFSKAYKEVLRYFGLDGIKVGFSDKTEAELSEGWNLLQKYLTTGETKKKLQTLPCYPSNILEYFGETVSPTEWLKEGIKSPAMKEYSIRVDSAMRKIVIPHHDIEGNLCGIRGRSFDPDEVADGKKYMPIYIEQVCYNHPLGQNLYGLYQNQEVIRRTKKVVVFEGEKSVLLTASYYNIYSGEENETTGEIIDKEINHNFSVAACGSSFSQTQLDLLLKLGIREIIFCFDKENDNNRDSELTKRYEEKLLKITLPLAKYVNVYVVMDYEGLLDYKDSPVDKGKDVFEQLLKKKIPVFAIEAETKRERKLY